MRVSYKTKRRVVREIIPYVPLIVALDVLLKLAIAEDIEKEASIAIRDESILKTLHIELTAEERSSVLTVSNQPSKYPHHIMKRSRLLALSASLVCQIISGTFATPIESQLSPDVSVKAPLIARQKGTYSGTDTNINASLAGTYNCFKGGTWARQTELDIPISEVCGTPVHDVLQFTPFSFVPNADHAYPPQQSVYELAQTCFDVSSNCDFNPQNGQGYLYLNADILAATHANTGDCVYALGRIREICHGDNGWTRGGWFTFIDGTSFGVDPQTYGKNQ